MSSYSASLFVFLESCSIRRSFQYNLRFEVRISRVAELGPLPCGLGNSREASEKHGPRLVLPSLGGSIWSQPHVVICSRNRLAFESRCPLVLVPSSQRGGKGGVDVQVVADEGWVDPWSVVGIPCKHVGIPFKKLDQLFLLLRTQLGPHLKESFRVVPEDHPLQILAFCLLSDHLKKWHRGF